MLENRFIRTVKLPRNANTVVFRLAKFHNQYGQVVPALEFNDSNGPVVGGELVYIPLEIDNSQEANPCIAIVKAETTKAQNNGTGSNTTDDYILNDGEYMVFTSAEDQIKITYKIGTGTTAIANITKNSYFLSSNGDGVDSTQDLSSLMNVELGIGQRGLKQKIENNSRNLEIVKNNIPQIQLFPVTVSASSSTGTVEVPRNSVIVGYYPTSNQDQFVDSVVLTGTTITVTLAAAATADNKFNIAVITNND